MKLFKKINSYLKNPTKFFVFLANRGFFKKMDDEKYLKLIYKGSIGKELNINNPQTFNEKIQWLKIYDRKPIYSTMVDKYAVREYIADTIGDKYLIPLLGVYDDFSEIDFDKLPEQFVIKCNHDSGGVVVCTDKSKFDIRKTKRKIEKSMKKNYYYLAREWPYKDVKPKILIEKYLTDGVHIVPEDYKVYCFNGKPEYIVIFHDRFNDSAIKSESVYDTDWNLQPFSIDEHFEINKIPQPKPDCLKELLEVCSTLSKGFCQVRLDFYIINERLYFGEITLHTASGLVPMNPKEYDEKLGDMIDLKY